MVAVNFDWKDSDTPDLGFVADDAIPLFPKLVKHNVDTGKVSSFNYRHYTAVLTKVVQMQKEEIDGMKSWICSLEDSPEELCSGY